MPNSFRALDALPQFTGTERTEDKVAAIQNYLFMLLEELRYILQNLGTDNFNSDELDGLKTEIRNAVKIDLSSGGDMATIQVDLAGLHTSIRKAEGNISALVQTAQEISTRVNGKIDGVQAQTLIAQNLNTIRLTAEEGTNQSTISISANGVVVDSAVAKFQRIVADSIVANASIVSPVIISGNGEFELTTDDTPGSDGLIINHVDFGFRTPILRIYYDSLGRLSITSLHEALLTYNANGLEHTLELYAPLVKVNHKLSLGSDSYGTQTPTDAGLQGVEGQMYFQIVS